MILSASEIVALHEAALARWLPGGLAAEAPATMPAAAPADATVAAPALAATPGDATLADLVEAAHFANFTIWGLEDEARRRDVGDARIAAVKRAIDPWNQRRNDLMEAIDTALLAHWANVDVESAELHSETAGMIIDRLSILALKIRNMERVVRSAAAGGDGALEAECRERASVLTAQRDDLAGCLARLLEDFAAGRRRFKSYRQLKSYNDERLNPALGRATGQG